MATAAKTKSKHKNGKKDQHSAVTHNGAADNGTRPPMTAKEFERELVPLQEELVKLQEWVKPRAPRSASCSRAAMPPVRAGPSSASPNGSARASSAWLRCRRRPNARNRRCTFSATSRICRRQARSYLRPQLVQPRRCRAGHGLCTEEQVDDFSPRRAAVEQAMVDSGIILIKYWLEVSQEEQTRRLEDRIDDGRKIWN